MRAALHHTARALLLATAVAATPPAVAPSAAAGITDDAIQLFQLSADVRRSAAGASTQGASDQRGDPSEGVGRLEAALGPLLAAVPRNERGTIDAPAARYALHRLFNRQRSWRVEGLDPEGRAWNSSGLASITVLRRLPPSALASLLARWNENGLHDDEVALLASTIENLLHGEAAERLRAVYELQGLPTDTPVDEQKVAAAVDLCLASYVLGQKVNSRTYKELLVRYGQMDTFFPSWNRTQKWVKGLVAARSHGPGLLSFDNAVDAMEVVSDGQGHFWDDECRAMKSSLMSIEEAGTGRVRLADFYGEALGGRWQFQESADYLRRNGALDEGNPGNVRVIIPNYINGLSNCVGASDYHSVCCVSECEDLRGRVERALGRPEGSPEEIAAVVSALPSATVPARGTLQPSLLLRLRRIAADSGGLVPVYGRLFAQWMHHAYPRECEYPHLAGKTSPLDLYDMEQAGLEVMAASDEMRSHASVKRRKAAPVESVPWVHHEELLGAEAARAAQVPPLFLAFHALVFTTASLGLAWLARLAPCACRAKGARKPTRAAEAFLPPSIV